MKYIYTVICVCLLTGSMLWAQETAVPAAESGTITEDTSGNIPDNSGTPPETIPDTADIPDTPSQGTDNSPAAAPSVSEDTDSDTGSSPEAAVSEDEEIFVYKMNQKGSQFIKIGLMVNIPFRPSVKQLFVGGSGTLGYMRFINSWLAVGGDASFAYMTTIGDNIFTYIPLMAKVMFQPTVYKFEFPLTLGIGGAFENYNNDTYFGLVIKPEVGAFYRHSPSWSFGIGAGLYIMPQWSKESHTNYTGLIMDVSLTARYHF